MTRNFETKDQTGTMLHPVVRKIIGYELNPEEKLLVDLLNEKATNRKSAVDPARLTGDKGSVKTLGRQEVLEKFESGRVYLTKLGRTVAKGARKTKRA